MKPSLTKLNSPSALSASPRETVIPIPTEYLPPANSIDERVDRVSAYYNGGRRAAAQLVVFNVLAGIELIGIQEQIAHGEWLKWCEKHLPDGMSYRSANYFMGLAEALIPKIATVANFDFKRLQIANGELTEKEIKPFAEAVQEVTNGKAYTDLLREYGLMADKVHQKDRDNSRKKEPTAEDQKALNLAITHRLANDARAWRTTPQIQKDCEAGDLDMLLDEFVATSRHIRDLMKSRRSHKQKTAAPKPQMSPAQRAKIAANARARWAKLRAQEGKKRNEHH